MTEEKSEFTLSETYTRFVKLVEDALERAESPDGKVNNMHAIAAADMIRAMLAINNEYRARNALAAAERRVAEEQAQIEAIQAACNHKFIIIPGKGAVCRCGKRAETAAEG